MPARVTIETFMDQKLLREVEALCTAEDYPACQAACPLHLDLRALLSLIESDKLTEAWQLYAKAIPLAPIIARTCNAPCRLHCKRSERGGAVEIAGLEQFLAQSAGVPSKAPFLLPKRNERVAVVGGGLRGLAAANSLVRKGYSVTILEASSRLGGCLRDLDEAIMPAAVLEKELDVLLELHVTVEYNRTVPTLAEAQALIIEGFSAVFVSCASPLDALADGATLLTGQKNIVAGSRAGRFGDGNSSIYELFDGISAAISIDRLCQEVSVDSGREKEGSFRTKLYTNLGAIQTLPPVKRDEGGYDKTAARAEAARCIRCECNECVKSCTFMQEFKLNPRRYIRMVYNNLSIAMGSHDANGMINTCAVCGQCEAICPNGLNMGKVFLAARSQMVHSGKMPPSAHEFALLDMDYSMSDAFFLARCQSAYDASQALFFPGCQLPASEPGLVRRVYADLTERIAGGVGLLLGCCGIMAHWSGNTVKFEAVKQQLTEHWKLLGSPEIISACPTCTSTLGELIGIPTRSIFEVLGEIGLPEQGVPSAARVPPLMVLHNACGARHNEGIKRSVRELAAAMSISVQEGAEEERSPCCGYGGLMPFAHGPESERFTDGALQQLSGEANVALLTYCVNCRDRFRSKGRDARHLLELLYPPPVDEAPWKPPTWSTRQENRARFKREVLRELWGEKEGMLGLKEEPLMELFIDENLERKLERTHILHSDIRAAITQAEAAQTKITDSRTGHFFTSHRPANVTYWVEYAPAQGGFHIYNAYSHRMTAVVSGAPCND
ncbi:pyridine nucleotide-disulfide oxidoreductase/dicluster-binding protein [Breznakiellaceae bacterium SP9]